MNTINNENVRQNPTFEEFLVGVLNTRRIDVGIKARDTVLTEMGYSHIAAIYAMISSMQLPDTKEKEIRLHEGMHYFFSEDIGEIIKLTRTRLQLLPSEAFREWFYKLPYLRNDTRHSGSYLVPVGCLGWIMLLTDRDGIMTFDHYPTQNGVAPIVFIKRAILEALRRCLKSRNHFEPLGVPNGKVGFKLTKSSLTLGNIQFLGNNLEEAINERLAGNWTTILGKELKTTPEIKVTETGERWFRKYEFQIVGESAKLATITLLDKTFYAEI